MNIDPLASAQLKLLDKNSAFYSIRWPPRLILAIIISVTIGAGLYWPYTFGVFLFGLAMLNYLVLLSFRLSNVEPPAKAMEKIDLDKKAALDFSILLPLKNEGAVIEETIRSIENLDNNPGKKELLIIVETNDLFTREHLRKIHLPDYARIIDIPTIMPFTKGRALLYGLEQAKNRIITVFDAESRPEPLQLRKADALLQDQPDKWCIQSKVRISNKNQNWITRNFATEYFEWFDQYLQELSNRNLNFGLGGNSFYISKENLVRCGAWDPFNVTEDAELSVRLIRAGIQLKLMESYTDEICPHSIGNWILQRTRWNKGLLITQIVHFFPSMVKPGFSFKTWISFWLRMVAGSCLPFFNLFVFLYFLVTWFSPRTSWYADLGMWTRMMVSLVFMWLVNTINFGRLKLNRNPVSILFGVSGYILLHILAGFIAYYEYIVKPLKWNNTKH